jgi:hypothetical protein
MASTRLRNGANARRMFQAITASIAALPTATITSICTRPSIASSRSLSRAGLTSKVHCAPDGRVRLMRCGVNAVSSSQSRSSQAHRGGAASCPSGAAAESKAIRDCASRKVSLT